MSESLRNRLSLYFIALSLIPLLIVGYITVVVVFDSLEATAVRDQGIVAEGIASQIRAYFDERLNDLGEAISVGRLMDLSPEEQEALFENLIDFEEHYAEIALVGGDGMELVRANRRASFPLGTRSGNDAFEVPLATGQTYIGLARFDPATREPVITMAVPVFAETADSEAEPEVTHVLIAAFRAVTVADVLEGRELGTGQEAYITSIDNRILVHTNPAIEANMLAEVPEADGRGTSLTGEPVIIGTSRIPVGTNRDIVVVVEESVGIVTELGSDVVTIIAIAVGFTLVIAALVVIIAVRQVVKPIEELSNVATDITNGSLDSRANTERRDEIGQLASAFNSMTDRLRGLIHQQQSTIEQLTQAEHENRRLIRELKDALLFKDQFLATMSHELRTPLNAIQGYTGIALMQSDTTESQKHMLERIKINAGRLLTLINDILDISRINAGRIEIVNEPINLHDLVTGWYEDHQVRAGEAGLDFILDYDETLPETLTGDAERLTQIASNLLVNAFKFTTEGRVTLQARAGDDPSTWQVIVRDTGQGIPETWHHLIFDEFRQVDGSSRRKHGGSGLGLSIVKKLCVLMGGQVQVDSRPGAGSTFTVTLPLQDRVSPSPEPLPAGTEEAAG